MDLTLTELSQASLRKSSTVSPERRGSGPPGFPVTSVSSPSFLALSHLSQVT